MELEKILQGAHTQHDEMSLEDYLRLVEQTPRVSRSAHARMYDAIMDKGVDGEGENRHYKFFDGEIFGIDPALNQIVDYFASSAQGMDIRRRILLLLGPVGAAKSATVSLLKRGYEAYARTDEGAMYGIVGCPHHEEPLHAVPEHLRGEFAALGAFVEGNLCPYCRTVLDEEYGGEISRFRVERIYPDEARRVSIGTFAPSDPLTQDVSELTGSMDLAKLPKYGSEADPRAYQFNGAINVASRGMLEIIEALKLKTELLYSLLTLAQERQVKAGRFELFYVDEILIAHTNEAEFERFAADRKNEAIQNRIYVVKVPYNLVLGEETKIYERMLRGANMRSHIAPHTLQSAARWALLSRYEPNEKYPPAVKLDLYNGDFKGEHTEASAREAKRLSPRDGMQGVSPRQVLNALSVGSARKGVPCINPIDMLQAISDTLASHIGQNDGETAKKHIAYARELYDKDAKEEIEKAFVYGFAETAQSILLAYLDNAEASLEKQKVRDPVTKEDVEPDDKLMRAIESEIAVSDAGAKEFRREILAKVGQLARRGEQFRWDSHPRLKEAIQKRLFADVASLVKVTTSTRNPDPEQQKRIDQVIAGLTGSGYCEHCAMATLKYVGQLLNR